MTDRFDLEQNILNCWNIVDDIGMLYEGVLEHDMSTDDIANTLLGLKTLYQMKFDKCFQSFETCLRNKELK
jgi:hypothetical protein